MNTALAKPRTSDFVSVYDRYSKMYCDPVEVLFTMASDVGLDPQSRISAAKDLVSYRYPKQKSIDMTADEGVSGITVVMGPAQIIQNQNILRAGEEFRAYQDRPRLKSI